MWLDLIRETHLYINIQQCRNSTPLQLEIENKKKNNFYHIAGLLLTIYNF